jgi:uncharacterized membrane protein (DUF441 family)
MASIGSEHLVSTRIRAISLSVALMCCLVVGGCSLASQLPATQPAGVTQQLMIRSLERALAQLDLGKLRGPGVNVDVFVQFVQNANQAFVKEFVTAWLQAHGVRTVSESPEIKVKLFASVYGTDSDHTLIGIPSFQAPVVNVPFPEIALFKWERNRGQAELRIYEFEAKTDTLLGMQAPGIGRAKYDNFTVLLFIGFTVSNVEKRE